MDDDRTLGVLKSCCLGLESDKLTERKKNADLLRDLIENAAIVRALDENTLNDDQQLCTWDSVFQSCRIYFLKEATKCQKDEGKADTTSAATRKANAKMNCVWFLAVIVRKANRERAFLDYRSLIDHVARVSQDVYLWENFAAQHLEMMVTSFLNIRGYWKQIDSDHWIDLLNVATRMYTNTPEEKDDVASAQFLYYTLLRATQQRNVTTWLRRRFDFFGSILKDHMTNINAQEYLLGAVLLFCKEMLVDYRSAVCRLGEDHCILLIRLHNGRPEKKDVIRQLLHLIVIAHHPCGVIRGERAAFAHDWDEWGQKLRKIHRLVDNEITKMASTIRNAAEFQMEETLKNLAVDVAKQIYSDSLMSEDANETLTVESTAKRRRVTAGMEGIIELIQEKMSSLACVPWLEYVTAIMEKYPDVMSEADYAMLLLTLCNLLNTCSDMGIADAAVGCAVALARPEVMQKFKENDFSGHWNTIQEVILRMIALEHGEERVHRLFQHLVESKVATNPTSFMCLMLQGVLKLSKPSLESLCVLMQHCTLPRHLSQWTGIVQGNTQSRETKSLRVQILEWLLPAGSGSEALPAQLMLPPKLLGSVLAALAMECSSEMASVLAQARAVHESHSTEFGDIERTCLTSSFQERFDMRAEEIKDEIHQPEKTTKVACKVDEVTCRMLMERLARDVDAIRRKCDRRSLSSNVKPFESVIYLKTQLNILIQVSSALLSLGMEESDVLQGVSDLIINLLNDIQKLSSPILGANLKNEASLAHVTLLAIKDTFMQPNVHESMIRLLKSKMTTALLDLLLRVVKSLFERRLAFATNREGELSARFTADHSAMKILASMAFAPNGNEDQILPFKIEDKTNRNTVIPIEAAIVVCRFFCMGDTLDATDRRQENLRNLLLSEDLDIEKMSHAYLAAQLIQSILNCRCVPEGYHSPILVLLQNLCRYWHGDSGTARVILSLLKSLYRHLSRNGSDESKKNAMKLLGAFRGIVSDNKKTTPVVAQCFLECTALLSESDPKFTWAKWDEPVGQDILNFLTHGNHCVALKAATLLPSLFARGTGGETHQDCLSWQRDLFKKLYFMMQEIFQVEGITSDELLADEGVNRTSVALHSLGPIIVVSPYYSTKAMFALYRLRKDYEVDIELLQWILQQAQDCLNLKKPGELMSLHIDFLINQWIKTGNSLEEFPWQLFHSRSQRSFFEQFKLQLTTKIYLKERKECLSYLAATLNVTEYSLIQDSYPAMMAKCIPYMAISQTCNSAKVQLANQTAEKLEELLGKDMCLSLLSSELHCVLIHMLQSVHDASAPENLCDLKDTLPDPDPPCFATPIAKKGFAYLNHMSNSGLPMACCLARDNCRVIQTVLLELAVSIHTSATWWEQLAHIHRYNFFVEILGDEFRNPQGEAIPFMARDIIHTYLRIIRTRSDSRPVVSRAACRSLATFCQLAVTCCADELKVHVPSIVTCLVGSAETGGKLADECLSLLRYLLVEQSDVLKDVIINIEPLPETDAFEAIRRVMKDGSGKRIGLREEMEHFVERVDKYGCRVEGLRSLGKILQSGKEELFRMCNEVQQTRLFSKDCMESPLHSLIFTLLKLVSDSTTEVAEEAAKCLGEVGPVNLGTLVLRVTSDVLDAAVDDVSTCSTLYLIHLLKLIQEYLVSDDIDVVQAASRVLRGVMATKEGQEIFRNDATFAAAKKWLRLEYLEPFRHSKRAPAVKLFMDEQRFTEVMGNDLLWIPPVEQCTHEEWITSITSSILKCLQPDNHLLKYFLPLMEKKAEFCEEMLPFMFLLVLNSGNPVVRDLLSFQMSQFFAKLWDATKGSVLVAADNVEPIYLKKPSVRTLLRVVQFLRQLPIPPDLAISYPVTPWSNNFWLRINYLHISRAALFCANHFAAVLYAEIWCAQQVSGEDSTTESSVSSTQSALESLSDSNHSEGPYVQSILMEAYCEMVEPDAVFGCGNNQARNLENRVHQLEVEGQWHRALCCYDLMMGKPISRQPAGVAKSLAACGLFHLLDSYVELEQQQLDTRELSEHRFECKWRLGQWDLDSNCVEYAASSESHLPGFHQCLYQALQMMHSSNSVVDSVELVRAARLGLLPQMKAGLESSEILYPLLAKLQTLQSMEQLAVGVDSLDLRKAEEQWKKESKCVADFKHMELVVSARLAALKELQQVAGTDRQRHLQDLTCKIQLSLASSARKAGFFQVAERQLWDLKSQETTMPQLCTLESALLAWKQEDHERGRHLIKGLLSSLEPDNTTLLARTLELYGNWLAESKAESPMDILEKYLKVAVNLREKREDTAASGAHLSLAKYADAQHQVIMDYMQSGTYEAKLELTRKAKEEADRLHSQITGTKNGSKDMQRAMMIRRKQAELDHAEIKNMKEERRKYLQLALRHYLKGLSQNNKHDLLVFRIVALWFHDSDSFEFIDEILKEGLPSVASYKFVPLLYQMAARLDVGNGSGEFQEILTELLMRCAKDHPHHALPVIMALAHSNADEVEPPSPRVGRGRSSVGRGAKVEEGRVVAARQILQKLKKGSMASLVSSMEDFFLALIRLANVPVDQGTPVGKSIKIPSDLKLLRLRNMENVAIPTVTVPVSPIRNYENIIGVTGFDDSYSSVGGINAPKKITCRGTDGVKRPQLLKGQDDLRQDAVMQQIFTAMNLLLQQNEHTWRRKLLVRTYKVVPMSQRSGILEWCQNTQSIGDYLIGTDGKGGAHGRYHPSDLTARQCRLAIHDAGNKTNQRKLQAYQEVCAKFQPALHHFFLENFHLPGVWFEHRLAYIRSIATSSIVGYIVGLGDRHVQNILIDKETAEVIHIDFGIAFEQGRILPTPETVPFRLTRDIVDGMGVCGVEGVFRKSCELTLEVLRQHKLVLLTIVEVLLYDPLYSWAMTPAKACQLQGIQDQDESNMSFNVPDTAGGTVAGGGGANKMAERALLRIQQKLQGVEDGTATSVTGQVNLLLQQAVDPANLSRLFSGWQPYI